MLIRHETEAEITKKRNDAIGGDRAVIGQARMNVGNAMKDIGMIKSGLRERAAGLIAQNPHGKNCTLPREERGEE